MAKKFDFLSPGIEIREIDQSFIPAQRDAEGPIIIGRTRKGPANKPVKVRSLDDFVSVFGLPVAGGNGTQGDVWREGNTVGPTYASYAAQAWLASEQSPVTMVRIAGEQRSDATTAGYAGWQVGAGSVAALAGDNTTAYGLFICDEADTGEGTSIVLRAGAGFNASVLELDNSKATTIQFVQRSTLGLATTLGAVGVSDGLKFEIDFDDDNADVANGTVARVEDGTGSVAKITCGIGSQTTNQIFTLIATAIQTAIDNGDITGITVSDDGAGLVTIVNLDTSNYLLLGESVCGERDQFRVTATGTNGIEDDSNGAFTDQTIRTNTDGWAGNAVATRSAANGSLAAVLYCATGSIVLSGKLNDAGSVIDTAGSLIESVGNNCEFTLKTYDEISGLKDTLTFNFSRNSSKYIRTVLNTNPQLTNTTMVDSADRKTYWLGESFVDHLDTNVDLAGNTGTVYAILMPLGIDDTGPKNWGYHKYSAREAKSGWVFSDRATNEQALFRLKSMHVGEEIQRNYLIAIEQITAPSNPSVDAYGTFTVAIKDIAGNTVERYSGCNLNPASPNYVAAKIGDQYQTWNDTDKRYRTYGDYQNQSDIFYIQMAENVANGGGQGLNPAGFFGPVRPKGFGLVANEANVQNLALSADFTGSVVRHAESANLIKGHAGTVGTPANLGDAEAVKFVFPKMRMRDAGSDGGAADQARSYWGVRPKLSAQSSQHDPDYIDYTRALGMGLGAEGTHTPGEDFEYSFIFSLDDIISSGNGVFSWSSGSYGLATSYTSGNDFNGLLDLNVRQFIMPVWGGSEGFDITEMEPLRNELVSETTLSEKTSYVDYSISKALDSISDAEVVPANMLAMPGIFRPSATNKMINVAESRKDVLAIIDLEGDYRPRVELNDTAANRLGSVSTAVSEIKGRNLNSSYAATFYPWVQVSDNLNGSQLVWLPPSVAALGAIGRSQATSELWFAPAGFNRGGLGSLGGSRGPRVLQARQRLDSKERDSLYEVNINPIATFPAEGVVIFGQKTLQADASALDRINVRRLVLYLKSAVSSVARNLLFDNNVEGTWSRFKSQVNPILSDTRARFGLTDYKLILDETTTTADLIDRNIMYAKIYIKPARAIEYIVVDFVITKTGADFV